jgi:hypothetical protein
VVRSRHHHRVDVLALEDAPVVAVEIRLLARRGELRRGLVEAVFRDVAQRDDRRVRVRQPRGQDLVAPDAGADERDPDAVVGAERPRRLRGGCGRDGRGSLQKTRACSWLRPS